jgi:hypothetical protein
LGTETVPLRDIFDVVKHALNTFRAVVANGYGFSIFEDGVAKIGILFASPNTIKSLAIKRIAQDIMNVFVKTAWRYGTVPVYDCAIPEMPTGIADFAFG